MYNILIDGIKNIIRCKKSFGELVSRLFFYVIFFSVTYVFVESIINDKLVEYEIKKTEETTSIYSNITNR